MKMPWKLVPLLALAAIILACGSFSGAPTASVAIPVATALQPAPTAAAPQSATQAVTPGISVSFANVGFVIPPALAGGASSETVPAVNDQGGAPWDVAPAYARFTLQSYQLQGTFFQPQIMILPAQEYAAASNGASISIQRLQAILSSPAPALGNDALPRLPYANAEQAIGAQPIVIPFQDGSGLRVLAEYAQYFAPINNHDLFYHFQGLTADGKYYIVAVLPVNTSFLAANSDPAAILPPDGIPFPGTSASDPNLFASYYQTVTNRLSTTAPGSFQPTLTSLDTLIGSLHVSP